MISYVIFDTSELNKIYFEEVLETSIDTVRRSIDGTKTFVKWSGNMPSSISLLRTRGPTMTLEEIDLIVSGPEWNRPLPGAPNGTTE